MESPDEIGRIAPRFFVETLADGETRVHGDDAEGRASSSSSAASAR